MIKDKSNFFEKEDLRLKKERNNIQKQLVEYEVLRKHYFEQIYMDIQGQSISSMTIVAELHEKQQEAIKKENYEVAGEIQKEINEIINNEKKK